MVPLRVLCVDDEPLALRRLEMLLHDMPGVTEVGGAATPDEAYRLIAEIEPHVMMLDVELGGATAFDLLDGLGQPEVPPVVFVTAHERYAVRAFEVPALDYILKPARPERLRAALDRVRLRMAERSSGSETDEAGSFPGGAGPSSTSEFWVRRNGSGLVRVPAASIEYATSADDYVCLHVRGREYLVRETLKTVQARLPKDEFLRIHRSAIVRISAIAEFRSNPLGRKQVVMTSGARLNIGRVLGRKALAKLTARS
jgi:DNA-binding LytR/AlgR family response regulator